MERLIYDAAEFVAAFLAGAMNSVAGGGALLLFPLLIWLGLPPITANATITLATWPGSLASMWGYRRELRDTEPRIYALIAPSIIGGVAGAILLRRTPAPLFDRLVPLLVLFATLLFAVQEPIQRRFNAANTRHTGMRWMAGALLFQLAVGIYGGYFGAGMGILMLAALGILGHDDIHQMNGLKTLLAACINAVAALYFVRMHMVSWPDAAVMTAGTVVGGVGGARLARRAGRHAVRRTVVVIGFAMALALLIHF